MAKKKFDTIMLFDNVQACTGTATPSGCGPIQADSCNFASLPPLDSCANGGEETCQCCLNRSIIPLLTNEQLNEVWQDRVTIVGMFGFIRFKYAISLALGPDRCAPSTPTVDQYAGRYSEQTMFALRKANRTQADVPDVPQDNYSPFYTYDWTEGYTYWKRMFLWEPVAQWESTQMQQGSIIGVCNDVDGGATVNVLTDGTGNIDTAVDTTCCSQVCQAPAEGCPQTFSTLRASLPPWHTLRIKSKRHIVLRRDDDLLLHFEWRHPARGGPSSDSTSTGWGCNPSFPNETSKLSFWSRIAAVIQYN